MKVTKSDFLLLSSIIILMSKTIKEAFIDSLTIFPGYLVLGIGFGILLFNIGGDWISCLMMSGLIYAGSMQYIMINLISSGASIITTFLMTLMVNIRHLFYGVSMIEKYNQIKNNFYLIFGLTDETFSIVVSKEFKEDINKEKYYFFITLFDHCWWILGSMIGNLLGNIIPFDTTGIEFSMTALFVVICVNQYQSSKDHIPAFSGLIITFICLLLFGSTSFLIPSMVLITLFLLFYKKGETNE